MITTAGNATVRPVDANEVKELILVSMITSRNDSREVKDAIAKIRTRIIERIDELDDVALFDGKRLVKTRYPRIMVRDNVMGGIHRVGENYHDELEIYGEDGQALTYLNQQCMVGTMCQSEGYSFVNENFDPEYEAWPSVGFDKVWVEEEEMKKRDE